MKKRESTKELSEGEWILLYDDEIIDHSANIEDMLLRAQERFPTDKYPHDKVKISKVFSKTTPREVLQDK